MGGHRFTREGHESLCLKAFPKENLILAHYVLNTWWLQLLEGLGHYVIRPGSVAHILYMIKNIMNLGYTYAKCRLKNAPDIFCKTAHLGRLIAWIPSRFAWTTALRGRDQYLLHPSLPKEFSITNNQEGPNIFDTYKWYTLWESGCTLYIKPCFELYKEYKPLEKGYNIEVNGIGGIIKSKGIGTVVLGLEEKKGKLHNLTF